MRHDLIYDYQDVPTGYKTYSVLLVPDHRWFENVGFEKAFTFFQAFKSFGQILGDDHLACWFYCCFGRRSPVDIDVIATIGGHIGSQEELAAMIAGGNPGIPYRTDTTTSNGAVGLPSLDLEFHEGPYTFSSRNALSYPTFTSTTRGRGADGTCYWRTRESIISRLHSQIWRPIVSQSLDLSTRLNGSLVLGIQPETNFDGRKRG